MEVHEQNIRKQGGAGGSSSGCWTASSCGQEERRSCPGTEGFAVVRHAMEKHHPSRGDRRPAYQAFAGTAAQAVQETKENADAHLAARRTGRGLLVRFVDWKTHGPCRPADLWHQAPSKPCVENPASTGLHSTETATSCPTTKSRGPETLARCRVAANQKGAARWSQPIAFLDESGFMLQPTVRRTWAPSGRTPILVESARHDRISAIGALSISPVRRWMDFSFQLHHANIDTSRLITFLRELHYRFRHRVVLIWDNLRAHFKTAKYFSLKHPSWFHFEYLPPYCPELNPVEDCWSYGKYGSQPNFAARDLEHLHQQTNDSLSVLRRNQSLLPAFLKHTKLQI